MTRIIQFSDTHFSTDPELIETRRRDMARAVAAINALQEQPALVVHTGDASNAGQEEEYAIIRAEMEKLNAPWVIVPGNRDSRARMRRAFGDLGWLPEEEGPLDFVVPVNESLALVGFDSKGHRTNKGWADEARAARLLVLLEEVKAAGRRAALAMHHPPYVLEEIPDPYQYEPWEHAGAITDVVRAAGNVSVLITGHAHRYIQGEAGGAPAHTITATASDLRKGPAKQLGDAVALLDYRFNAQGELLSAEPLVIGLTAQAAQ